LENIDIDIDIDMAILENIDIDKGILQNIDIDKISYRLGFGISNTPRATGDQGDCLAGLKTISKLCLNHLSDSLTCSPR